MKIYNILDYGVKAGLAELQTKEIQSVLDLCCDGGGKVIFPRGIYRTAGLYIHSDTTCNQ